ncbi:MAG: aspartate ammonia-lyase [Gemmataceae bacterium]
MNDHRTESDLLGPMQVPRAALYGVHTARALENFPLAGRPVQCELIHAYGMVKLACAKTNRELGFFKDDVFSALESACEEMIRGELDQHIVVDALQGGAGTSTNLNVNEVLANRALVLLGRSPGDHQVLHSLDDVNRHQSTNDTYPTALRIAAIYAVRELELDLTDLVDAFQAKERDFASIVKVGRTQLQDAVLITLGRQMAAYAEAFARDRWRVSKCEERLRVVNLGGTAIGTGLGAPREYIFRAIEHLRDLTGLGVARAENLVEATQNTDALVEVSGILRATASSLLKVSNDLRLLASGPDAGLGEIRLPARQAGSSIMPGKVNPVIPEAVAQCALAVLGHDQMVVLACSTGNLELNQFYPLIADSLLMSLSLLRRACRVFTEYCVTGIEANARHCQEQVESSGVTATCLVGVLGYEKAQELAVISYNEGTPLRQVVIESGLLSGEEFDRLISPEAVMQLGSPRTRCKNS